MSGFLASFRSKFSDARAFALAIAMAVMIVSPVAEAMACSGEIETSISDHAGLVTDSPADQDNEPAATHDGICAHGHCHHVQPLHDSSQISDHPVQAESVIFSQNSSGGPKTVPDALKRPPRA